MTSSSIQSRLWLTYILLITFVLLVSFVGIAVAFRRSPLLYRQVFYRISLISNFLKDRLADLPEENWNLAIRLFLEEINYFDVNIAILNNQGVALLASGDLSNASLPSITNFSEFAHRNVDRISLFRDENKQDWFYQVVEITPDYFLLTAAPRPDISIRTLFQDELMKPLFRAGIISSILALIIGLLFSKWITSPLKNISTAAEKLADGEFLQVPEEGPREIRQLASTMNEMNRRVQDSLQSQQDFVANVTHEFKTPLTSIQGFAQALLEDAVETPKERRKASRIIMDETMRLNSLVNELLILAKMDAGMIEMSFQSTDINQIFKNLIEKFQIQLKNTHIKVVSELDLKEKVQIDGERMMQVFSNLLANSIKYSNNNGLITIRSKKENDNALIEISDTGIGISTKDQKRIFERFYQADKSRKGGPERGVGLGLAIAKEIVEAHGGEIGVQSMPEIGTTFMVKLPLNHGGTKQSN